MKHGIHKIEDYEHLGKADYHIHTLYSDGKPTPQEVLDYVENHSDLDVIAICDHDTIEGALEAKELMKDPSTALGAGKKYLFELIIGEEVTSKEGHIVGLFLKKAIEPGLPAKEVVKQIHAQGGITIAAHPFERTEWNNAERPIMNGVGLKTLMAIGDGFDGVEIINATPSLHEENVRAALVNSMMLFRPKRAEVMPILLKPLAKDTPYLRGNRRRNFALRFAIIKPRRCLENTRLWPS